MENSERDGNTRPPDLPLETLSALPILSRPTHKLGAVCTSHSDMWISVSLCLSYALAWGTAWLLNGADQKYWDGGSIGAVCQGLAHVKTQIPGPPPETLI